MRTGRGEFLHKTYRDAAWTKDDKVATERVLLQVAGFLRHELPIRLAHRILDLEKVPLLRDMNSVMVVKVFFSFCVLSCKSAFSHGCVSLFVRRTCTRPVSMSFCRYHVKLAHRGKKHVLPPL
mmetsp:Transcript_5515/g.8145  ORF Transcript_5515/g.8145 Transcript_5515/m.8145 type:complete len:123 (-) Transcript_5515:30-398(-)